MKSEQRSDMKFARKFGQKFLEIRQAFSGYFDRGKQTFEMQLQDGFSTNKHAWATAAYE